MTELGVALIIIGAVPLIAGLVQLLRVDLQGRIIFIPIIVVAIFVVVWGLRLVAS